MLCWVFLLFYVKFLTYSNALNYSLLVLPTPRRTDRNEISALTLAHNIDSTFFYGARKTSSQSFHTATPSLQGFISKSFNETISPTFISTNERTLKEHRNSNQPPFSKIFLNITSTRGSEISKISQALKNTWENYKNANGSDLLLKINLVKNENTSNSQSSNRTVTKGSSCDNEKTKCHGYVTRWVDFYLNVGGWIMLAVVLVGVLSLVVTHLLGRRSVNKNDVYGLRGKDVNGRYRGHWV